MTHKWKKIEAGWYRSDGVGSVRSGWSLRISDKFHGKWWIIPRWTNDDRLGPYKTRAEAVSDAERLFAANHKEGQQ